MDLTITVVVLLSALLLYIPLRAIYDLYFHPLAKFPGPTIWAISRVPFLYAMLAEGKLPHRIKEFHDTYGSVVRVAPDELSFIDSCAWAEIYTSRQFVRPKQWGTKPPGIKAHNLISAPQADHLRYRKALSPAFSEKAIKLQEPIIISYVDLLIKNLHDLTHQNAKENKADIDMVRWMSFVTFDIASDLGWGTSLKCLENRDYHPWVTIILHYKSLIFGVFFKYYPLLDNLAGLLTPKSARDGLELVIGISENNVRQRLSSVSSRPDFMSYILSHNEQNPGQSLSEDEMVAASMTLIVAGSDSVSTVISGAMNHLIQNQKAMTKLATEVRSSFTSEDQINSATTKPLVYLNAVLQEALRLCPPTPDSMRRLTPEGGSLIAGHYIPENMTVGISCYAAFTSNHNFVFPEAFIPERWLGESEGGDHDVFSKDKHDSYRPFGFGPRQCMGQMLALLELRIILARLLWNFDFYAPEKGPCLKWSSQKIYWAWSKEGVHVQIAPRRS